MPGGRSCYGTLRFRARDDGFRRIVALLHRDFKPLLGREGRATQHSGQRGVRSFSSKTQQMRLHFVSLRAGPRAEEYTGPEYREFHPLFYIQVQTLGTNGIFAITSEYVSVQDPCWFRTPAKLHLRYTTWEPRMSINLRILRFLSNPKIQGGAPCSCERRRGGKGTGSFQASESREDSRDFGRWCSDSMHDCPGSPFRAQGSDELTNADRGFR